MLICGEDLYSDLNIECSFLSDVNIECSFLLDIDMECSFHLNVNMMQRRTSNIRKERLNNKGEPQR